jgi:hypothetical protein
LHIVKQNGCQKNFRRYSDFFDKARPIFQCKLHEKANFAALKEKNCRGEEKTAIKAAMKSQPLRF